MLGDGLMRGNMSRGIGERRERKSGFATTKVTVRKKRVVSYEVLLLPAKSSDFLSKA